MEHSLLHVISFTLRCEQDVRDALRHLRRLHLPSGPSMLLFADLPPAAGQQMPQDLPLIRMLQSGVMSMDDQACTRVFLLVRRRAWSDAERQYVGAGQPLSCRDVIAQLLSSGKTDAVFDAATLAPASFKGRYQAVLFSSITFACTPDTPLRMFSMLSRSPGGALGASVLHPRIYPHTALDRAALCAPIFLSPLHAAKAHALMRNHLALPDAPILFTAETLISSQRTPPQTIPLAQDCFFIRKVSVSLRALFAGYRAACMKRSCMEVLVPPIQMLLFFAAAVSGFSWFAALALLPELWALPHPRQWPGALLRTALLPITAMISLDVLACRALARSPLIRLRIPPLFRSALGAMLSGAALLALAISGAHALTVLLPVCLLWLFSPILLPALESPTIERIPLHADQLALLHQLAESAYPDAAHAHVSPSLRMLVFCAGSMIGALETDEAARRVQALLESEPVSIVDRTACLVCAQYLREHMSECDAALRDLPAQLENAVLRCKTPLAAAQPHPLDALFLPLGPSKTTPVHPFTLPLTHPHSFLKQLQRSGGMEPSCDEPAARFLALTAAALSHPFHALLARSPVAAPYMLLLTM